MVKWGIKPKWFKTKSGLINIRAETLIKKNTFKKLFVHKRCFIPSTGFYEWHTTESGIKVPYHIKPKDDKIFTFAGLWDDTMDESGDLIKTFSIITTEANSLLKSIHDRMPVILSKKLENVWLSDLSDEEAISVITSSYSLKKLEMFRVSEKINSPKNNSVDMITPV